MRIATELWKRFARCVFRTPPEELAGMKKLEMWQTMAKNTPIVLRELESVDSFSLSPDDYRDWTIPTLLVLGGESPPQYRATIEALGRRAAGKPHRRARRPAA